MIIISLGFNCYIKKLIQNTNFKKETDIFDYMNSFEFNKNIKSLNNKFNIFDDIIKSPINVDLQSNHVYYNQTYSFRLPHDTISEQTRQKYKRRFERFINYKNINDTKFVFIRQINTGYYDVSAESLNLNYNDEIYSEIMSYLPSQSIILLLTNKKLSSDEKKKISKKFILLDNTILSGHIDCGEYKRFRNYILKLYIELFNYINYNFNNLDVDVMKEFINNKKIGID